MRALIACEFSGRVRDAFAARGWDAWSCDLVPCEAHGKHFQYDVREVLWRKWDLLIAFPPCTYLCASGMHRTHRGMRDPRLTDEAVEFARMLLNADVKHIALENPVGVLSSRIRIPDCVIQPWQFGHPESKKTCLWLKNLPVLRPSRILQKPEGGRWENQTPSGQDAAIPSQSRTLDRSRTYPGIAEAMACQWSEYVFSSLRNAGHARIAASHTATGA